MMPAVSRHEDAAVQLAQLQADGLTGCLTIASASAGTCRVYLLGGHIMYVLGPGGGGEASLSDALSWPDASLSFDEGAEPPDEPESAAPPLDEPPIESVPVPRLSDDPRLTRLGNASLRSSVLFFLVPLGLVLVGVGLGISGWLDAFIVVIAIALLLLVVFAVVWITLFVRFRVSFLQDAVTVPGGLPAANLPDVIEAPAGMVGGTPQLAVRMQTRCATGSVGRCRIELYSHGIQIWKGPEHPEPRWQFAYRDLMQVECVDIITPASAAGMGSPDQYLVRLITNQPRMAFLFGGVWFGTVGGQNRNARLLMNKLRQHRVPAFDEFFES
jgi:hypothetical protein